MTKTAATKSVPGFTQEELVSKIGFCEQLKGGVIMDVINAEQARIAEDAGACAVMALEPDEDSAGAKVRATIAALLKRLGDGA